MTSKLRLSLLLSIVVLSAPARAACMTTAYRFHSNGDTVATRELLASGERCFHTLRTNRTHPANVYTGVSVEQRPSHGTVTIGAAGFQYQSQSGYRGTDSYSVRICMRFPRGGRGCSVVVFDSTIE